MGKEMNKKSRQRSQAAKAPAPRARKPVRQYEGRLLRVVIYERYSSNK